MLNAVVILLFYFCFSQSPLYGHSHEKSEPQELMLVYEQLVKTFRTHLLDTEAVSPADVGYFESADGHRIAFSKSALNQLMALAVADFDVAGHQCDGHCRQSLLAKAWTMIVNLPLKILTHFITMPAQVGKFMAHPIRNGGDVKLAIEGFARRSAHGYDPTLFLLILISQGAWESIESVVMPGGVHMFCTLFNTILLTATVPLERVVKLARNSNRHLTLSERLRYSLKSLLGTLRLWAKDSRRMYIDREHGREIVNVHTFTVNNLNALEETLMENGFFQSVYAARLHPSAQELRTNFPMAALERDLALIFADQVTSSERLYLAFVHTRGLAILVKHLQGIATSLRESKILPRQTYLEMEDYSGRMRKVLADYTASLTLYSSSELPEAVQKEFKGKYQRVLYHFIESMYNFGVSLRTLLTNRDVKLFADKVSASNREAIGLLHRLKVLRSHRESPRSRDVIEPPPVWLCPETFLF